MIAFPDRNAEIIARRRAGEKTAALARAFAISEQRVDQIVRANLHRFRGRFAKAVSIGKIVRGTVCQMCGGAATEAHHFDYGAIEHCIWVCARCHGSADVLRQRSEAERLVGETLLTVEEAAHRLCRSAPTVRGWIKKYNPKRIRIAGRGGRGFYRADDIDRLAVRASRRPIEFCARGHRYTPSNTQLKADGHRTCKACNTLHASGGRRSPRASRYAVLAALETIGATCTDSSRGRIVDFEYAGVRFHMRAGGGSPWIVTVAGDQNSEARLWTAAEIVAYAKRNSRTEQMVA